jgi:hypothetical protein
MAAGWVNLPILDGNAAARTVRYWSSDGTLSGLLSLNPPGSGVLGVWAGPTNARTADTNAYAANDVIGQATGASAALQFANLAPGAGEFLITSVALEIDAAAIISGETSYLLHLYNVTPPSALGDNAAFDLPSGDRVAYLGSIGLGAVIDLGSTLYLGTDGINKQVSLASTDLFAYLVTVGPYTPTSARVYKVFAHGVPV